MSKEIKTTKTKKPTQKWDNIQKIGFWGLILVNLAFWAGVYLGNVSAHNGMKELEQAKTSAVEEYKANAEAILKAEQ